MHENKGKFRVFFHETPVLKKTCCGVLLDGHDLDPSGVDNDLIPELESLKLTLNFFRFISSESSLPASCLLGMELT